MTTKRMLAQTSGAIATMTFNNPARHNAVSLEMWEAGERILAGFAADPAVRVVVLTGAGDRAFVSGADISRFEDERASAEAVGRYNAAVDRFNARLLGLAKPAIAMIRGYCIGGGLGIAIGCDIRICSEGSRFAIPAARLGLGYGYDGIDRLVALVGPAVAKEIFFTGRRYDAAMALRWGLVNHVVTEGELAPFVTAMAETIAANAPLTIRAVKAIVGEIAKDPDRRDRAACERQVAACFASADYVEGRRAFMEKRPPRFTGS